MTRNFSSSSSSPSSDSPVSQCLIGLFPPNQCFLPLSSSMSPSTYSLTHFDSVVFVLLSFHQRFIDFLSASNIFQHLFSFLFLSPTLSHQPVFFGQMTPLLTFTAVACRQPVTKHMQDEYWGLISLTIGL